MSDTRKSNEQPNHLIPPVRISILLLLLLWIPLVLACRPEPDQSQNKAPRIQEQTTPHVVIKSETLLVEIRSTPKERARGLMFRDSLPEKNGMFFIFEFEAKHSFWMKNTTIPLSIAFINSKHIIIDIQDMPPLSTEAHAPRFPCLYALEVNQNWFASHGIRIGDTVAVHF